MTTQLKKFHPYRYLRQRSKVERAIHNASVDESQNRPLRYYQHLGKPKKKRSKNRPITNLSPENIFMLTGREDETKPHGT